MGLSTWSWVEVEDAAIQNGKATVKSTVNLLSEKQIFVVYVIINDCSDDGDDDIVKKIMPSRVRMFVPILLEINFSTAFFFISFSGRIKKSFRYNK